MSGWGPATLLLMVLAAAPVSAQRPYRAGLWIEAGGGGGKIHIDCSNCAESTVIYGSAGYLRGGATFSDRIAWGLELFSLLEDEFGANDQIILRQVTVSPVVLWYPWQGGVFVKGGVGISRMSVDAPATEDAPAIVGKATGSSLTFGLGLDLPIHRGIAVTTNFGVYYSANGDLVLPTVGTVDDMITTVYQINFAVTVR
ncbi:MAG TPA: outer membrane beta-barrel protein [Gemmatimonadales bacterium]|nr:outer membrane beta-barrel protein [Gemmatimonadales bacterium]